VLAGHCGAPAGTTCVFAFSAAPAQPALTLPGILTSNLAPPLLAVLAAPTDAAGDAVLELPVPAVPPGLSLCAQVAALDPTASGELLSASLGLRLVLNVP
jgi:hypothetical protein